LFDIFIEFLCELVFNISTGRTIGKIQILINIRFTIVIGRRFIQIFIILIFFLIFVCVYLGQRYDVFKFVVNLSFDDCHIVVFESCLLSLNVQSLLFESLPHQFDLLVNIRHLCTEPLFLGARAVEGFDHVKQQFLIVLVLTQVVDLAESVAAPLHSELHGVERTFSVLLRQQVEIDFSQVCISQATDEVIVNHVFHFETVARAFGGLKKDVFRIFILWMIVTRLRCVFLGRTFLLFVL